MVDETGRPYVTPSSGVEGTQQKILGQKGLFKHLLRAWTSRPMEWRLEGAVLLVPTGLEDVASATHSSSG